MESESQSDRTSPELPASPACLVPGRSDYDIAEELKADCKEALDTIARTMQKAAAHNMSLALNISPDQFGRFHGDVKVMKHL